MTVGVYGIVAGIVKLDDAGLHLSQKTAVVGGASINAASVNFYSTSRRT